MTAFDVFTANYSYESERKSHKEAIAISKDCTKQWCKANNVRCSAGDYKDFADYCTEMLCHDTKCRKSPSYRLEVEKHEHLTHWAVYGKYGSCFGKFAITLGKFDTEKSIENTISYLLKNYNIVASRETFV